jgi:hypothetical protein
VRRAASADAETLAAFECSTGPWYEDEVQHYVRRRALEDALRAPQIYRLLLAFDGARLVAVGAHAQEALILTDDTVLATRLQVVALGLDDQGRVLEHGTRLSDVVISTVIADALRGGPSELVTAIVAGENLRSIALCERNGLRSQTRYSRDYVRLSGRLVARR